MAKANRPEQPPADLPADAAPDSETAASGMAAFETGRAAIRKALETMPARPGVYRMLDDAGEPLYVGKAKNLKNRVQNYVNPAGLNPRILKMISQTRSMEIVTTHTEVEALLLESNLIKRMRPRYNILLRDDKSFPYIVVTRDHDWPQLTKHRGARTRKGEYFGPFASAGAVNRTLNTLQKAFPLRSCSDSIFAARTRPCLQYQIRRCTAPCVGRIDADAYAELVDEARDFLSGRSQAVQQRLSDQMAAAAEAMEYETAAVYRDRLRALAHIQSHQGVNVASVDEADVIAIHQDAGQSCIQVFFFRAGQNWGNRAFFPAQARDQEPEEILAAFIGQFYDNKPPPREILVNIDPIEQELLAEALAVRAGRKVRVARPTRGARRELVDQAVVNAREALGRRLAESSSQRRLLDAVGDLFQLDASPNRIEVYDNSHTMGRNAIGGMIVAGPEGMQKGAYRKFNIRGDKLTPGDDYAMMREVLERRFSRLLKARADADALEEDDGPVEGVDDKAVRENQRVAGDWPDLVLIDGGAGHLAAAQEVFADLGIDDVALAAIAKGPDRNAGREKVYVPGRAPITLPPRSPVLYFLQRLRDEAHRFAIGTHRARRGKDLTRSQLDQIDGIGPRRKRALLARFGSVRAIEQAAVADLETVEGVSRATARRIYEFFHPEG
jgi:excinuclease ABC subunit C